VGGGGGGGLFWCFGGFLGLWVRSRFQMFWVDASFASLSCYSLAKPTVCLNYAFEVLLPLFFELKSNKDQLAS